MVLAFLAAAIAVSIWQVRGSMFAIPLATIPLAAWVGEWRARVAAGGGSPTTLKMALAWIVSLNVALERFSQCHRRRASTRRCRRRRHDISRHLQPRRPTLRRWQRCRRPPCLRSPISARRSSTIRIIACWPGPTIATSPATLLALQAFMGTRGRGRRDRRKERRRAGRAVPWQRGDRRAERDGRRQASSRRLPHGAVPAWLERLPGAAGEALEIYRVASTPEPARSVTTSGRVVALGHFCTHSFVR